MSLRNQMDELWNKFFDADEESPVSRLPEVFQRRHLPALEAVVEPGPHRRLLGTEVSIQAIEHQANTVGDDVEQGFAVLDADERHGQPAIG